MQGKALFLAEKGTLSGDSLKFLLVNRAENPDYLFELATKGTKKIVLIEMVDAIGADIGITTRWTFMQDHPFGIAPEPYAGGLPAGYPSYCKIW